MLDKHLLSFVFTYLIDYPVLPLVSKYWDRVCFETLISPPVGPEQWYINKINKQEIARLMFDIRWQQEHNPKTILLVQPHLHSPHSHGTMSAHTHVPSLPTALSSNSQAQPTAAAAPAKKKPNPLY
ncbi:hypothetical protein EON65_46935, partial [archaeon]